MTWKLIKYNVAGEVITQLFDIKNDPYETKNLAEDPSGKLELARMTELLRKEMLHYNDDADLAKAQWGVPVIPAWKDNTDPKEVEFLRSLAEEERKMRGF